MRSRLTMAALVVIAAHLAVPNTGSAAAASPKVWVVELESAIGPASADFFIRSLEDADAANVELVVLRLDTPGGLDKSMRDMIKAILASDVPVATFVAPSGSRAASAGTYIMYASHVAAMAPATNIGSSTPVSIGGGGSPFPMPGTPAPKPSDAGDEAKDESPDAAPQDAMGRKVVNDAVAYIKSLAQLRDRNEEWAEETVRSAANLSAEDALEASVIDLIADDVDSLLAALDGQTVDVDGHERVLTLGDAEIAVLEPDWRYKFLGVITDPNVAYILLMVGVYGLILEFYNPGTGIGGVTGVICLVLGAYALQMLPINYAGVALIVLGIGLLVAEAFSPSFGVFGIGGVIAFVIGSIILMDTDLPGYQISVPIIVAVAACSVGLLVFAAGAALKARNAAVVTGTEAMIGAAAEVIDDFDDTGLVRAFGEIWRAESAEPLSQGAKVTIAAIDGLTLTVQPAKE